MDIDQIANLDNFVSRSLNNFNRDQPLLLFGAGGGCAPALKLFQQASIPVLAILDNNSSKWGTFFDGIPVMSPQVLASRFRGCNLFISAPNNAHIIVPEVRILYPDTKVIFFDYPWRIDRSAFRQFLLSRRSTLLQLYDLLQDDKSRLTMVNVLSGWVSGNFKYFEESYEPDQYFISDIMKFSKNERFLDIGAYTGDTIEMFCKVVNDKYLGIIAIEPNPACHEALTAVGEKRPNIRIIPIGVHAKKGRFRFVENDVATMSAFLSEESNSGVEVDTVDNLVSDEVTLLKMDVEGLERDVLAGAVKTIRSHRPKLAICVYHRPDDLLVISDFVRSLNMDYRLYLRHHSYYSGETVLYAV